MRKTITVIMHHIAFGRCSIVSVLCPCCTVLSQVTAFIVLCVGLYGLYQTVVIRCQLSFLVSRRRFVSCMYVCMYRVRVSHLPILNNLHALHSSLLPYSLVCYDTHHLTFHRNGNSKSLSTTMLSYHKCGKGKNKRKTQKEHLNRVTIPRSRSTRDQMV